MKPFIAAVILFYIITSPALQAQEVVVTDAKVTFFVPAHTDDKDMNTKISATLYTAMGRQVALLDHCCGNIRFPDSDYTSATYQLTMKADIKKSELQSGYFNIQITPSAKDRWAFIPTFQVYFSDGTKAVIKGETPATTYTTREVSQQAPDTAFPFHLP